MAFRRTFRKKNVRRTRRARKSVSRARRTTRRVTPLRRLVRREIAKTEEVKSVQYGSAYATATAFSTCEAAGWGAANLWIATPGAAAGQNIGQGTTISTRVGNAVNTKRLVFTGMFYPAPYDAATNPNPCPTDVVLFAFKLKSGFGNDTASTAASLILTSFLKSNAGDVGATGQLDDLIYPVNSEVFSLYGMKRFKIGFSAYGNAGVTNIQQHYHNNDYKENHKLVWDLTKYVDKKFIWNDTGATEPSNRKLYIFAQALRADGQSATYTSGCLVNYRFDYTYTDA